MKIAFAFVALLTGCTTAYQQWPWQTYAQGRRLTSGTVQQYKVDVLEEVGNGNYSLFMQFVSPQEEFYMERGTQAGWNMHKDTKEGICVAGTQTKSIDKKFHCDAQTVEKALALEKEALKHIKTQ